ncbi:scavenger receptor cysteine-rich type 1 M130-like protein [Labeo rohita]|uniref:Scavenger receptor cysteine-rich type 1 M130-like protein n=1 Tax=Labeo rohita TaxID=84645 RepID=A0A498LAX1_LABRO|nr:scavenger receptor cysteine-rich type 1 M130-like protein [Labeo rohita]
MNRDTASLICQELNCGRSASEPSNSKGLKSHNWLDKLKCRRHDSTLWQCPSSPWGQNDCDNEVAKITCSAEEFKTAYYDDVTSDSGLKEEMVKEITPGYYDDVITDGLKPDRETEETPESYDDVMTSGQNSDIKKVNTPENYDDVIINRPSSQGATEFKEIRLTEGCEGNLEVFYNGSWGNVCYNQMNRDTASLICQELNCGRSASEPSSSEGLKAHNWLDNLKCRRHDSTLWQCPSSPWGHHKCDNEVAKITCSDLPVSTTPATTTSASPSVSPTVRSTSVTLPQTPSTVSPQSPVPPVLVIVLVVVLLLLLVPLLILIQQNRVMRRALSKRRHRMTSEAVYEEIQHRHNHFTQRDLPDVSVSTTPAIITSASPPVRSTSVTPPKTSPTVPPQSFVPPVLVIVLVVVLLLLLVPLLILIQQNRVMRRALTKRRHRTTTEAVYEEIQHRHNHFTQRGSSLVVHDGLVRLSGERQCEGEVEVFIHQVWRRVLLDSWSLTESSVVCRQLGCGFVLNFYGSSSSSPEHSHECVTGFQCSGSEAHLGNCSSPQTLNCSSTQQLSITCLGSLVSEELHSGYEDADELLSAEEFKTAYYDDVTNGSGLKEEMVKEITQGYYDDVITDGLKPDRETEDKTESYDDVMTSGLNSDIKKVNTPENYDDVIINRPSSQGVTEGVQEEYDDVTSVSEDVTNLLEETPESYDDVMTSGQNSDIKKVNTPENYDDVIINRPSSQGATEEVQEEYDDVTSVSEDVRNLLGSLISEELHSGYEDADEFLSAEEFKTAYYDDVTSDSGLKEEMVKEITPGYYDDVITDGLKPDRETEDKTESYDDVMTSGLNSDIKKVNTPENYDDVIINRPSSQGVTEGVQEEYDDVTSVSEDVRNRLEGVQEEYDDVTSVSEDVRNLLDYDDVEEELNKNFGSVITPTASFQQI